MNPTTNLWYDHDVIRGKLTILEDFLPSFCVCPFTVGMLTDALAACLRAHTEREERLFDAALHRPFEPPPPSLQELHDEHENQRTRLAVLHALITEGNAAASQQITEEAQRLIKDLRQHMAKEEEELFPFIDHEYLETGELVPAGVDEEAVELLGLA